LGGPQGVGALALRKGLDVTPLLTGGGQEKSRRAGTENVAGIVGFGAAIAEAVSELDNFVRLAELRDALDAQLQAVDPGARAFGAPALRLPNTTCVAMPGVEANTQVMALDLAGIAVSAGSACSSGKVRASHVLAAMGVEPDLARTAIRVSLGRNSTEADIVRLVEAWTALRRRTASSHDPRSAA
jgi:cysteine desulfurase